MYIKFDGDRTKTQKRTDIGEFVSVTVNKV